jgi:leucyl-tRNA synthetase
MGPLEEGGMWDDAGVAGMRRFLDRTWRLVVDAETDSPSGKIADGAPADAELERALHLALKKITEGVDDLRFNTAVSEMMIFVNLATRRKQIARDVIETFVLMLSPFAPHLCEELWRRLGHTDTLAYVPWPAYDEAKMVTQTINIAVQVNGKVRAQITLPADVSKDDALATAKADEKIASYLARGTIRREIYVPKRLINFVVK